MSGGWHVFRLHIRLQLLMKVKFLHIGLVSDTIRAVAGCTRRRVGHNTMGGLTVLKAGLEFLESALTLRRRWHPFHKGYRLLWSMGTSNDALHD